MAADTIFPYPTLRDPLEFSVRSVMLDGEPAGGDALRPADRLIYLYEHFRQSWEEVTVSTVCTAGAAELDHFEAEHGGVEVRLTAHCRATNARDTAVMSRSRREPGRWTAEMILPRDGYRGRVNLRPVATATVEGIAYRTVAAADEWAVYFDPAPSIRINETLPVKWVDFDAADAPAVAKRFSAADHVVDLDGTIPTVLLNSSFENLHALLDDRKGRAPVERALHDGHRLSIARGVWMALIQDAAAAVESVDTGDDTPAMPTKEWQAEVLDQILPLIDPELSEDEALRLCAGEWRSHPGSATFASRAQAVAGEVVDASKVLRRTLKTLTRGGKLVGGGDG